MINEIVNVNWNYPTPIWFGLDRSSEIVKALFELSIKKPLLVTDPNFSKNENFLQIIHLLKRKKIEFSVFSNIKGNPTGRNVSDGVEHFISNKNDGVVAIGGGSSLDAGKAIAFMTKQKQNLWYFEDVGDNWTKAETDQLPKVIAIPTTAGTGSETGRSSLILDESDMTKKIIFHPSFLPDLVILDPKLTLSLPPHLTAATGMDALAHCLEAYCARGFHPMADGIALEGIKNVKNYLIPAFKQPDNLTARSKMLVTSSMGSTAFQKGLGVIHSLSHPINAVNDVHHGLSNAIFMPYVLKFNAPVIRERIELLSKYLELKNSSFDGFLEWVLHIRSELALPHTLKALDQEFNFELLSHMALKDPSTAPNPRDISYEEMKELYINSYEGIL
tara:strand:+ start:797 stop:1963 length:1167 start_codon:yes stop_codon:yes gene_type:complete